jgi:hypothetical protein
LAVAGNADSTCIEKFSGANFDAVSCALSYVKKSAQIDFHYESFYIHPDSKKKETQVGVRLSLAFCLQSKFAGFVPRNYETTLSGMNVNATQLRVCSSTAELLWPGARPCWRTSESSQSNGDL